MAEGSGLLDRPWAFGTAVLGVVMLVGYVILILAQGSASFSDVLPGALLMAVAAIAALAAALIEDRRLAGNLMVAAAVLFALLGALSILSIGIGFLLIAVLATVAAIGLKKKQT